MRSPYTVPQPYPELLLAERISVTPSQSPADGMTESAPLLCFQTGLDASVACLAKHVLKSSMKVLLFDERLNCDTAQEPYQLDPECSLCR